uniref:Uncharacterized protein n=1 Tax=Arundo donax TaxID=35708 RepID=A0A0A9C7R9_ARUDO
MCLEPYILFSTFNSILKLLCSCCHIFHRCSGKSITTPHLGRILEFDPNNAIALSYSLLIT